MSKLFPLLALSLACCWFGRGDAQDRSAFIEELYRGAEKDIQADYNKFPEMVEVERKRRIEAGEPPAPADPRGEALEGYKSLLYNKAVSNALCAETAIQQSKSYEEAKPIVESCIKGKMESLVKHVKLSDYASIIDRQKQARCAMKSRDYKNEIRFPPFAFLRTGDGPHLFDYNAFNECLLSD